MRILIVNKFLYPNGGSESYIFKLGEELVKQGHEVQYFGMDSEKNIVGNRVQIYTANMDFHTGKLGKLLYPFKIIYSVEARKAIRKVLNDFEPDVVHLNNFNFQLTPSIIYEVRRWGKVIGHKVKILYTAHDTQLVCPNHLMRIPSTGKLCQRCLKNNFHECVRHACIHNSKIKSFCAYLEAELYRWLKPYKYIDCVLCPSYFMEKQLQTRSDLRGKTRVLHNFITCDDIEIKEKGTMGDYVLYFGRYSEEKGINTLLRVCRDLVDIPFVFAGSGPMEEEINNIDNINNVGFQKGEELYDLIKKARFSVIPSECYENCPFSVMESIKCGTPVIASCIGGIPELINEGENGELFSAGNVQELKKKIEVLWNDRTKVYRYSTACEQIEFDTVESYCKKMINIIEQLFKEDDGCK